MREYEAIAAARIAAAEFICATRIQPERIDRCAQDLAVALVRMDELRRLRMCNCGHKFLHHEGGTGGMCLVSGCLHECLAFVGAE